jgi:tetratricopeptide (TPR) repeat protein
VIEPPSPGEANDPAHTTQPSEGRVLFGDTIQILRDAGRVTIRSGRPPYRIAPFVRRWDRPAATAPQVWPSRLLSTTQALVPFVGRQAELADAATWLSAYGQLRVRLLHGDRGQGKTRLAHNLATSANVAGWATWRASPARRPQTTTSTTSVPMPPEGRGLLVLVDDADRWPIGDLLILLDDLRTVASRSGVLVRALMLARAEAYWWSALLRNVPVGRDVETDSVRLGPIEDPGSFFAVARNAFATLLGVPDAEEIEPPSGLSGPAPAPVLSIEMFALAAVEARLHQRPAPQTPSGVIEHLVRLERAHWAARSATPSAVIEGAVRLAVLIGPMRRKDARAALVAIGVSADAGQAKQVLDDIAALYPPDDPHDALDPALLEPFGEVLLALVVQQDAASVARLLVKLAGADPAWGTAALCALTGVAQQWPRTVELLLNPILSEDPDVAAEAGGMALARLAELPDIEPALLVSARSRIPDGRTVDLDIADAAIAMRAVSDRHVGMAGGAEQGTAFITLVRRLLKIGQFQAALPYAQAAVEVFRSLHSAQPSGWLPELAQALNALGTVWSGLGHREAALPAMREAVEMLRPTLVPGNDAARADLAGFLSTLSTLWRELGHRDQALTAAREAVQIRRQVVEHGDTDSLPDLAAALHSLGALLAQLGRSEEALAASHESVGLYRALTDQQPATYLPDLAKALDNLSMLTAVLGDSAQAIALAHEVVANHRHLVETSPAVWLPGLAGSLSSLGTLLAPAGRFEEAAAALQEAVEIYRQLAAINPAGWLPKLGGALNELSSLLANLERFGDAVATGQEAVELRRALLGPDHADTLTSLHTLARSMQRRGNTAEVEFSVGSVVRREMSLRAGPDVVVTSAHLVRDADGTAPLRLRFAGDPQWRGGALLHFDATLDIAIIGVAAAGDETSEQGKARAAEVLSALAGGLQQRYDESASADALDRAVDLHRAALRIAASEDDPEQWGRQAGLAAALQKRFERSGALDDLNRAIELLTAAMNDLPPTWPDRPALLSNLAAGLRTRYDRSADPADLSRAISLLEEAVYAAPPAWSSRPSMLSNLAAVLRVRFEKAGDPEDLHNAVELLEEAVETALPAQPERASMLSNLAVALQTRFDATGDPRDLDRAVQLLQRAVETAPPALPERATMLANLAVMLRARYQQFDDPADLERAVMALREAITTAPPNQPERPLMLFGLALALRLRSEWPERSQDLDEAVILLRQAAATLPVGDPQRPRVDDALTDLLERQAGAEAI